VPLVVVDADVLGRRRTGDETYVLNLLRELPAVAGPAGLRIGAVTREPDLLPSGVEPFQLTTAVQELRMAWALPRLLRRAGAALVHTQYAIPARCPCPAVVTIHDLSFERDPSLMRWKDRLVFRHVVPRAARGAARVVTVSERTRHDLEDIYGVPSERIVVTPNGADPVFTARAGGARGDEERSGQQQSSFALSVGAIQTRKNQLAALRAATAVGLELVVAGPAKDRQLAAELEAGGARLVGYLEREDLAALYRSAACLVQASRYEGFGLPVLEAMACGCPVVTVPEPALLEVAGDAAVVVAEGDLAEGIRRAVAEREMLAAAGLERAARFSWQEAAARTAAVYEEILAR
jgi:glycosyltransferase involved in cell wall biosynthesis